LAGVGDSLDLVVVGAFHGRGKRTSQYGAYLLACYDPQTQEYQTICKLGTGFSDEVLDSHTKTLKPYVITAKKSYYTHPAGGEQPSVWFEPKFVWEVLCADLSLSPRYMAGVGSVSENKGISLRFPRFIRVREDKGPEDATTSEQVQRTPPRCGYPLLYIRLPFLSFSRWKLTPW
jgi:DNA ligase 1